MASAQELEMFRRKLDEQMIVVQRNNAETVRTMGQWGVETAPRGHESREANRTDLAKTLTTASHSTDTRVRSILPVQPC